MATTRTTQVATVTLNDSELVAAVEDAFVSANEALEPQFTREITAVKWEWPNQPSPRDIVDTGVLRQSYTPTPGRAVYDHSWTVDYAIAVHEGARRDGARLPARPWTKEPLERLPETFNRLAKKRLGDVK